MSIEKQVRDYIVESFLFGNAAPLTASTSLLDSGVIDSTGVLELVSFIEDTFHVQVADQDMLPENLDSVSNIARFVARKLAETDTSVKVAQAAEPAPAESLVP